MDDITGIIVVLGVCVALPVLIVWIVNRRMANDTNRRADIVLAALDKNADIDVEEFLKKLNPPQKSTQEKLMSELKGGLICLFIGIVLVVGALVSWQQTPGHGMGNTSMGIGGGCLMAVVFGQLIAFAWGKKALKQQEPQEEPTAD